MGQLGNQMFQYAFLRSLAQRLGVTFYCPPWLGDSIFELADSAERHPLPVSLPFEYHEPDYLPGFNASALQIEDNTDILGYFQSWRYVDHSKVTEWFKFRPSMISESKNFIKNNNRRPIAAIHIRLCDFTSTYRYRYYVARRFYYERALAPVAKSHRILIFSDDPQSARDYIGKLGPDTVFMDGLSAADDLHIMANADWLVCSPSTFCWWAAWLGHRPGRTVIVPKEGPFRPGVQFRNDDYWHPEWQKMNALIPIVDHSRVKQIHFQLKHAVRLLSGQTT